MWPPKMLYEEIRDLPCEVRLVQPAAGDLSNVNAVVTVNHTDDFFKSDIVWVHTISAGYDHFPVEEYRQNDVVLTNSSGIHRNSGGEHAMALMLLLSGNHYNFIKNQTEKKWEKPHWDRPFTLHGESVCIVGTGTMGKSVAERASCMGMKVRGVNHSGTATDHFDTVFSVDSLVAVISDARFVVLALPLSDQTQGIIGREEFNEMQRDAFLINIGRGAVVDEQALIKALREKRIQGAGLDVFVEEPLPTESELWELDDVVITPHCAGYFNEHYVAVADIVRENFQRISNDEELLNVVS